MNYNEKYRGCLIGGAAGDALGYAIEFFSESQIFNKYGEGGIREYSLTNGIAEISDDTQMTLFTANALILDESDAMSHCYIEWSRTQREKYPLSITKKYSWLVDEPRMFHSRAPGITCLNAIDQGANGTIESPINTSKGCGGIMRVAPVGLYYAGDNVDIHQVDMIGAKTAALTHGHELGYIPAAGLVHIVNLVAHNNHISLFDAVKDMRKALCEDFAKAKHLPELIALIDKAMELSSKTMKDIDAIHQLGEGWVAEETLAIAIYCALKYEDDFDKALIASVNHKGDSDSTGAVTGNILGAYLGIEKIPQKYINNLELKDVIVHMADELYRRDMTSQPSGHQAEVIILPKFQELKDDVEQLRTNLTTLLSEWDELRLIICQNIETSYMLELGAIEYKVYEAQCNAARLKRKIDLIQAKINRQKKVVISEIEESLDVEFEEYQQELKEQMTKMNDALSKSKLEKLSEKDSKELKKLYKKTVKALHPDIHPNATMEQLQLFDNAVTAYKNGDINTLRIIDEMTDSPALPTEEEDAMSQLLKEKKRLEKITTDVDNRINTIKEQYPYSMKEILEDPEKLAERKAELHETLDQYNEAIEAYQIRLKEILGK